jgi:hypothetical protein
MQGPLVWGRVLAARSVTPVHAPLGCGVARRRGCAYVTWRPVPIEFALAEVPRGPGAAGGFALHHLRSVSCERDALLVRTPTAGVRNVQIRILDHFERQRSTNQKSFR